MKRLDVLRVALSGVVIASLYTPASAEDEVAVRVPYGVDFTDSTTSDAPNGLLYVTVTGMLFRNPSGQAQSYRASDLHLLARGHAYTPVVRPKLGAIDTIENGIVGPREILHLSATFLVPAGTSRADVEFTPHWMDDNGRSVDFCCYYV